jgi:hypothetical protein
MIVCDGKEESEQKRSVCSYTAKQSLQFTKESADTPPVAVTTMRLMSEILVGIAQVYLLRRIHPFLLAVDR